MTPEQFNVLIEALVENKDRIVFVGSVLLAMALFKNMGGKK